MNFKKKFEKLGYLVNEAVMRLMKELCWNRTSAVPFAATVIPVQTNKVRLKCDKSDNFNHILYFIFDIDKKKYRKVHVLLSGTLETIQNNVNVPRTTDNNIGYNWLKSPNHLAYLIQKPVGCYLIRYHQGLKETWSISLHFSILN